MASQTVTDADGKQTTTRFDAYGRPTSVERPFSGGTATTQVRYDLLGRRKGMTDPIGATWTWQYDSLGRSWNVQDPDAGNWTCGYDDAGRPTWQTDAKSQQTTLTYDAGGRLWTRTNAAGTVTNTYSEPRSGFFNRGRLTTVTSPSDVLKTDYDAFGRAVKQDRLLEGSNFVLQRSFDAGGYLTTTTYPDGDVVGPLSYDGAGRLSSIPGIVDAMTYDATGRPWTRSNANTTQTTWTYDPTRGFLERIQTSGPAPVQDLKYTLYTAAGLLRQVTSIKPGEGWNYDYDDLNHLTSATNNSDSGASQTFLYDAGDRITHNSRIGDYAYPGVSEGGRTLPHAPGTVNGALRSYDNNGNLISWGGRSPVWNANNLIVQIGSTQFSYDGSGERVKKTNGSTTSLYPFGDDYEVTNGVVTKYVSVDGLGVIAKRVGYGPAATTYWVHTDRLGSIDEVTDGSGGVVLERTYRPYGETLSERGTHEESRGWIDQRNDDETGLTYLHARYFDPKLGTFLSPDPIGVAGGMNQYGYTFGNPVNASDRSGLAQDCFTFEVSRGSPPPWAGYESGQGQTSGGGSLGPLVFPASVWQTTIRVCYTTPDPPAHQPGDGSNQQGQGEGHGQGDQGQGGGQNRGGGQNQGDGDGGDDGGDGDDGIVDAIKRRLPDANDAIWNPKALFENLGRLDCRPGATFSSRFSENMRNANSFIPGMVAPTGLGLGLRAGPTVGAAIGAPTVMGALTGAWRGTAYAGGVAFLSGGEALAASLGTAGLTGAATGTAFEVGLMIGSAADAFGQGLACR